MRSTSIRRSSKVRRMVLGGFALLLMVLALSGIGFYRKVEAGPTNALATRSSAGTAQSGGKQSEGPVTPNVRSFAGGAITINQVGQATPFPSNIVVAVSTSATLTNLTVTLTNFSHTCPDDVDMVLEGPPQIPPNPNGQDVTIFSDAGGDSCIVVSGLNITLSDAAAAFLPDNAALTTGTFKPSNYEGDVETFVGGPQVPRAGTTLGFFTTAGNNANGTWKLWVQDDTGGDAGTIGSWSLNMTFGPTLARMSGGSATVDDDGLVELKWQTGYEVDNLGFNIYREEGGQRIRVNKHIIAGSALVAGQGTAMTAGRNYRWRDTTAKPGQAAQYWVEAKDLNGSTLLSGPFSPTYSPGRLDPQAPSATLGGVGHGGTSGSGKGNLPSVSVQAAASEQTAFKLGVKETGYYRVKQSDLVTAGLSPNIDPRNLRLFEDGIERAIIVQGERDGRLDAGDFIEFYGTALDNAYTDTRVYQLSAGSQPGLRIKRAKGKGSAPGDESFLFTTELSERNLYFPGFKNGEREKFFGAVVSAEPLDRTLRLRNVSASASSSATLEVGLQGVSAGAHNVNVRFNDADLGAVTFDGRAGTVARFSIPQSSLKEGDNSIQLVAPGDGDVSLMGSIRMSYWHSYAADDNALQFTASGATQLTLTGFSNPAIRVLDVSNAASAREVAATVSQNGGSYSATVRVPGAGQRTLLAFASDRVKSPAAIAADFPSRWRTKGNKADLVILTRGDFISALQPLKDQRESQGHRVAIVNIQDVYDEFGFGNKNPQAIKDFFAYATSKWKGKPRFALLAGDASFDPKNYLGGGDWDIVPTKLIETQFLETACDDCLADFNGDGLAEMAVGRLPARSAAEMSALVAKIVGYDSSAPSGSMLLVSDASDTFDFDKASAALRAFIPGNMSTLEIDRGVTDDATSRSLLLNYMNQGQSVINYFGHGSVDILRNNLLTADDASSLANGGRLSLFVSMTCLNGYFHDDGIDSLGEAMLKAGDGGAVAAWASSGMCDPLEQATLNREFYRLLFSGGALTIGEAATAAKSSVIDKDIRRTWILLGDPTTRLR
jgi:peptidase C25-like protein/proprotein convertase P-domain-containing protein